jgi:hypothetical protein
MAGSFFKQQGSGNAMTWRKTTWLSIGRPYKYTRGGIEYNKTDMTQSVKGWSEEGIAHFNVLFDQVIADCAENPDFERKWIEARKSAQEEAGTTAKKRRGQPTQARSKLLDSDNDDDIIATAMEAPVDNSDSATDKEQN